MATIVNLFLDSTDFSSATAVYTDIDLTIKAPDGFYTYGTLNREQLGGLLQAGVECSTIQPCPEPVDCVVSAWSDWSACSLDGTQTRTRTVITPASGGGTACPVLEETQNCPVDCVVSAWSDWSACSGGEQTRTRTIVTQPLNGGTSCPVLTETQSCQLPTTQICYQGRWETNDPQHPNGSNVVYINANGDTVTQNNIWLEDIITINYSALISTYGLDEVSCTPEPPASCTQWLGISMNQLGGYVDIIDCSGSPVRVVVPYNPAFPQRQQAFCSTSIVGNSGNIALYDNGQCP